MSLLILLVLLIALGVAAWRWGHDSRDGRDWTSSKGRSTPLSCRPGDFGPPQALSRKETAMYDLPSFWPVPADRALDNTNANRPTLKEVAA